MSCGEVAMTASAACRTCGTEPIANARFCHCCGSPVVESETHAEYKQVTALFADVVRSMDLAAALDIERLREVMTELAERSAAVRLSGGRCDMACAKCSSSFRLRGLSLPGRLMLRRALR